MFTHLHVHTEYSMLDGISRIEELVDEAKRLGMDALGVTDHGTMYGVVDFYSACKETGIKPIIGCEMYVAHQSRLEKTAAERSPFHQVLIARNSAGYKNLMKLVTLSNVEGFHYKPRIDKELLEKHHEGLIAFSGCPSAEVPRLILDGDIEGAKRVALWYKGLFGAENYYFELQRHRNVPNLEEINQTLARLATELDIPLVVTNDSHYTHQADAPLQDIYICIQTNTNVNDDKRLKMDDDSYYLKSQQEMEALFPDFPEAVANTERIAAMCDVKLDFGKAHLPKYSTPGGMDADEYLHKLCWDGFKKLYPRPTEEAVKRLEYELEVIKTTRFANYFLVVWDIIDFVRRSNILYAIRGSAASSVALYCLGITYVDPLEYKLVFERFLNNERKEMPDIDMDFQDDRRDEVLRFVIERYGQGKVAQIITFGTLGAKAALRDVGRALAMSYGDCDRVARMVPFKARTLADALQANPEFKAAYDNEPATKKLVDTAQGLEGIVHHVSTHAAGVLICDEPLTETVPLQRPARGDESSPVLMTQYAMDPVAKLGLLKMDFLGLTNLTILDKAVKLVNETRGHKIDLLKLPLDDKDAFALLSSGKTTDVFQLESAGMKRYIKELKPSNLGDIAAMIALYRPGPMENIETFINSKYGRVPISYPHPSMKDLLDETYGIIVYQDQVLLILQQFAGYTLGSADIVRKAMGKKIASLMAQERDRFIKGAETSGYAAKMGEDVFNLIEPFAGYAFNKAHSVSYGLVSYWTAYFKAHYPVEYLASALNSRLNHPDKIVTSINECFNMGIPVLLPDINRSGVFFTIDKDASGKTGIRFGLAAIKGVGEGAVEPLVAERRQKGDFESIDAFCRRADVSGLNKRTLEALAKAGCFDSLAPRGAVLQALDQIIATAQQETRMRQSGQFSMFGGAAQSGSFTAIPLTAPDLPAPEKATHEKELLGVALSHNPLWSLASLQTGDGIVNSIEDLDEESQGQTLTLQGHVTSFSERFTREQKRFLIVNLDLLGGAVECIVWPDVLERTQELWQSGKIVRATGKLRLRGDQFSLACEQVEEYAPGPSGKANGGKPTGSPPPQRSNGGDYGAKSYGAGNGGNAGRGKPVAEGRPSYNANRSARGSGMNGGNGRPCAVCLTISETDDPSEDAHRLRDVVRVMLEYPGRDKALLDIHTGGKRVILELPVVAVTYSEELKQRLEAILGENTVTVQRDTEPELEDAPF